MYTAMEARLFIQIFKQIFHRYLLFLQCSQTIHSGHVALVCSACSSFVKFDYYCPKLPDILFNVHE